MDRHGHGTHVSGVIGAVGNNGVGVTGVNQARALRCLHCCVCCALLQRCSTTKVPSGSPQCRPSMLQQTPAGCAPTTHGLPASEHVVVRKALSPVNMWSEGCARLPMGVGSAGVPWVLGAMPALYSEVGGASGGADGVPAHERGPQRQLRAGYEVPYEALTSV